MPPEGFIANEKAMLVADARPVPGGSMAMVPAISNGTRSFWLTVTCAVCGPCAGLVHEMVIAPLRCGLPLRATVAVTWVDPFPEDGLTVIQESAVAVQAHVPTVRVTLNENDPPS